MTERERYITTLTFGTPDRIPFEPGLPRESTLKQWHEQGLPDGIGWNEHVREVIGIEQPAFEEKLSVRFVQEMIPQFEEKVIEEKERSLIVQDWKGNICEISKDFDVTYLRVPKDFVTRKWIQCPVESPDDWEAMKARYDPNDPNRIPDNIEELADKYLARLPYKTIACRFHSFVVYFSDLQKLGWVEFTGIEEPSKFQGHHPPGPPRKYFRLSKAGREAGDIAWRNPHRALYGQG